MRRRVLVAAVSFAALAGLPVASVEAKGPLGATVCGVRACADMSGFSLQLAGSPTLYRHVAPAPYFVVRIHLPANVVVPGADRPILYVPRRRLWRVTIEGSPVWLDVPKTSERSLRRAVAPLRAHAAPRTWAAVGKR